MTTLHIQRAIAAIFFILGGWALVAPQSVIDLTLRPEFRTDGPMLPFVTACFGSQAVLSGLFAGFARFTRLTFAVFGLALLPFLAFDVWFTFIRPVFTLVGLLDAVGNTVMLGFCIIGWRLAGMEAPPRP